LYLKKNEIAEKLTTLGQLRYTYFNQNSKNCTI